MSTKIELAPCHDRPALAHDAQLQGPRIAADRTSTGDRVAPAGLGGTTSAEQRDEAVFVEDWVI